MSRGQLCKLLLLIQQQLRNDVPIMAQLPANLQQIEVFLRLVETGSFTGAARTLNQHKSRISRSLQQLEANLGVTLFFRTTRRLQLTEVGQRLFDRLKKNYEDLNQSFQDIASVPGEVTGSLRITAPDDIGFYLINPAMIEFRKNHPQLNLDLRYTQEKLDLVKDSIDLALRIGPLRESTFKSRKLMDLEFVIVAAPKFLDRRPALHQVEQILDMPFVTFSPMRTFELHSFKKTGVKKKIQLKSDLSCNHFPAVKEMALAGLGLALLPRYLCLDELEKGELVVVLRDWYLHPPSVFMLFPYRNELPEHVQVLKEFLLHRFRHQ